MDKKDIEQFYNEFFNKHNVNAAKNYIAENYRQHNPGVKQGLSGLVEAFKLKFKEDPNFKLKINQIVMDEKFVAVFLESIDKEGRTKANVVDLYRIEGNKLIEHWDYFDKSRIGKEKN